MEPEAFQLQILHASDQEAGLPAIVDAVNFSAVLNALEDDFDNTLKLSSGDLYIAGPFLNASIDIYGEAGIGDILINNALGFQAAAIGNHEWDLGPDLVNDLLRENPDIEGPGIGPEGYPGTAFPYLSTNLDFSGEPDLAELVVEPGAAPQPNSITDSVVIEVGGEPIGIVGATTPSLPSISSIGNIRVTPPDATDIEALAAEIQEAVDALTATGINKVILLAHMQQIAIEEELAELLSDVDVIMAGGSNTLLANPDDPLRPGDEAAGPYPIALTSASDEPIYVINTDGNYKYVGQLVADFDENGIIVNIPEAGVFATDDAGVDRVYGEDVDPAEVADPVVVEVTDAIADLVQSKDGNVFGRTSVFLNGIRPDMRTQETNLGTLTAEANLFVGQQYDETVTVSIKNGGSTRDSIGLAIVPPGSTTGELELLPPQGNPLTDPPKREGDISQLDIENALRFNNDLSLVTVTASELKGILEHAVSTVAPGNTPGSFPQIGGMAFSFDATRQAIVFERDADQNAIGVETEGARIRSLALKDEEGNILDVVVRDGEVVGDPERDIRVVTIGFLAGGGDGYPFPLFSENRVDLVDEPLPADADNFAEFTDSGTEQDALAEYLAVNFPADDDPATPVFDMVDVGPELDENIQNLAARSDTVLEETPPMPMPGMGTPGNDILLGKTTNDTIAGGMGDDAILGLEGDDRLLGDPGNDLLWGGPGADHLLGGMGNDTIYGGPGNDLIDAGPGDDIISGGEGQDILLGSPGRDTFVLRTGTATANRRETDVLVTFEVGVDAIGLTGGLTFDDLILEPLGSTSTLIKIDDGSDLILGFVNRVMPDELSPDSFVQIDIGLV